MTNDELLAKIDTPNELHVTDSDGTTKIYKLKSQHMKALRAVAEIHKPQEITLPDGEWGANCSHCDFGFNYPCPTIQAIEKDLK